ncbi:MAG: type II toxin-antitoxin system HipA family toxin [Marinicaulis sp.]|nr:type II toxin-antitoxin system HipA family toxin [Marinicaulis sp.]
MSFTPITQIKVGLDFGSDVLPVGRLAIRDGDIYFEYDSAFLERGLEISPLRLPLSPELKTFDRTLFEGLPGVFNDSLPDGWGRLLLDRSMRAQGILPEQLSPLDRLAHVGNSGMGALVYEPDYGAEIPDAEINLDVLASHAMEVLDGEAEDVLQELLALNGSSAGARPKAVIGVDDKRQNIIHGAHELPDGFSPWLVKFPNVQDGADAGAIEYVYGLMAVEAGVAMTKTHLFPAQKGTGYFATSRFDREGQSRIHTHTACGALHSDFRTPSLDYEDLLALAGMLTRDVREVEKMFRLAVFNVLAHNRDDHSKNFTFLMSEHGEWALSPAYDLTFSSGPHGEQSTMVMGEGKNPGMEHLGKLGREAKIEENRVSEIIEQTRAALSKWEMLAKKYGVSKANIKLISQKLAGN